MKVPEPRKLPSGTYFIQLRLGGESVSISAPTRRECIQQAQLKKAEHRAGKRKASPQNITLREAMNVYIDQKRASLSPSTIQGYEKIRDQYFQSLMPLPLRKIDIDIVDAAIYAEEARVSRRGKPLSAKTICEAWHLISTVLRRNHASLDCVPDLPEVKKDPVQILSFEEIYPVISGSSVELECLLAACMSLTISEIRGLTKSKSIHNGKLTILETVIDVDGQPIRKKGGKEETRARILDIPDFIQRLIDAVDGDVICTKTSQTVNKRYQALLEKAGLPKSSFHKLRHTFASTGAMLKIQPEIIQEAGGWKTDHVMKRVYTHTFNTPRLQADKSLRDYFSNIITPENSDENANENANET